MQTICMFPPGGGLCDAAALLYSEFDYGTIRSMVMKHLKIQREADIGLWVPADYFDCNERIFT